MYTDAVSLLLLSELGGLDMGLLMRDGERGMREK